jgi:hypothetical protein
LILLLHDGLLVPSQRLLHCQVHSGVETLVAPELTRSVPCRRRRLHLLLKALLLLSRLLLSRLLLIALLLPRLLLNRLLDDLLLYLSLLPHVAVTAHGLERVVGVHHLQAVRDATMCRRH